MQRSVLNREMGDGRAARACMHVGEARRERHILAAALKGETIFPPLAPPSISSINLTSCKVEKEVGK